MFHSEQPFKWLLLLMMMIVIMTMMIMAVPVLAGVCGALADPHYFLFDLLTGAQMLKVNLPCSVVLARTVTYAAPDPICLIDLVLAHPETRGQCSTSLARPQGCLLYTSDAADER